MDGIDILAVLKSKHTEDRLVLVVQYRPPIKTYCVEFPAGLLDENESPEKAAIRELYEET